MNEQLVKIWKKKKEKTNERFFDTLNRQHGNKENTQICFAGIKRRSNRQNATIFT